MRRALLLIALSLQAQDQKAALEHAREVNLERAAKLPNFVADEIGKRYKSRHTNPPKWEFVDAYEAEISVKGSGFTRGNVRLNGKPYNKPSFPTFNWSVQFGDELKPLFDGTCGTTIEFDGRQELRGKQLLAYKFAAPGNGCFGNFTIVHGMFGINTNTKHYSPAYTVRFLIEDPGGDVLRFEDEAHEFPKGFGADSLTQSVTWDYVSIGDRSFLLPVATEIFGGFTQADLWHVVVEYKNHRHFETATQIKFE